MKKEKLELHYDANADILEIFIGEPAPTYFEEIGEDVFEGRDEETHELKGYKIFNFGSRQGRRHVSISLPANVRIESMRNE